MMTPPRLTRELLARLDGPHADEHTAGAAGLIAESARFLNYATGSHAPHGLTWPATVYEVTADLKLTAERLPQLLRQMCNWLAAQDAAGMLAMDDQSSTEHAIRRAAMRYDNAAALATRLANELLEAQNALAFMNGRGPNREAEGE